MPEPSAAIATGSSTNWGTPRAILALDPADKRVEVTELVVRDLVRQDEGDPGLRQPAREELPAQIDVAAGSRERICSFDPEDEGDAGRAGHEWPQTFLRARHQLGRPAGALDVDDLIDRLTESLPEGVRVHGAS